MSNKLFWLISVAVIFSMVFSFSLAGCKEEAVEEAVEEAAEEEAIEEEAVEEEVIEEEDPAALEADLEMWKYPRMENEEEFFGDIFTEFQKLYPNVNLSLTIIPWSGGPEKVNVAIASDTTPDIFFDSTLRQTEYAEKGLLVSVSDVIEANKTGVAEALLDGVVIDGERYVAATNTSGGTPMMINVALAKELGVADMLPDDRMSWTWEEFYKFCEAATEAGKSEGIYGIGLFAGNQSSDTNTIGWLMSSGANLFNEEQTEITLNSDEGIEALEFLSSLVIDGIAMPGASTLVDDDIIELFLSGKLVISAYGDIWMVNQSVIRNESGIDYPLDPQYFLFPTKDGTQHVYAGKPFEGISIFKNAGDEDTIAAAKAFVDFFLNSQNEIDYVQNAGQLPIRTGYSLYEDNEIMAREAAIMTEWTSKYFTMDWGNKLTYWPEIRAVYYPEIQATYSGIKDAQTALDDFAEAASKIVGENQ